MAIQAKDTKKINFVLFIQFYSKNEKKKAKKFVGYHNNIYICNENEIIFYSGKQIITTMSKKKLFAIALAAVAGAGFMGSCTSEDYHYDPNYEKELNYSKFAENFIKEFGDVSGITSWDFSSKDAHLATRATEDKIYSVAPIDFGVQNTVKTSGSKHTVESTFTKNEALYNNVKTLLPDNKEHVGEVAVLTAPNNSFTIYPISSQGLYTYDLYVQVGDNEPFKVFSKTWNGFDKPYVNGMATAVENKGSYLKPNYQPTNIISTPGVYIETEVGTPIQVYITNIKNGGKLVNSKNPSLGTGTGNAIIINATARPEGLDESIMPENAIIKYIGIEDNENYGDKDYNDLVLAVVGNPYTPQPIVIEEDEFTVELAHPRKRYMVEDLGTYDDFDFNDLVLDVEDIISQTYKATIVNGVMTEKVPVGKPVHKQKAFVHAMGGTIDFKLTIGKTTWIKSQHFNPGTMYNTMGEIDFETPLAVIDLNEDDWKYTALAKDDKCDNIVVTVLGQGSKPTYDITFGEAGKVPLMIAVDYTTLWAAERVNAAWIKDKMKK